MNFIKFIRNYWLGKQIISFLKVAVHQIQLLSFIFCNQDLKLIILTGADSSHYKSLKQFLHSAIIHESNSRILVFDLGLTDSERNDLMLTFPQIEIRRFEYEKYPDYFNIKIQAGSFAWKPVIIADSLNEFKQAVCWMDSGNIINRPLRDIRKITKKIGIYTPLSSGFIFEYTHPETLKYLKTSEEIYLKPMRAGGTVSIDYENEMGLKIANQWKELALIKSCIAPDGYDRGKHKTDQSVLSILIYKTKLGDLIPLGRYGFKFHQDID